MSEWFSFNNEGRIRLGRLIAFVAFEPAGRSKAMQAKKGTLEVDKGTRESALCPSSSPLLLTSRSRSSVTQQVRLGDFQASRDRLPSSAGSDEESVAGSDEDKAQSCAYATRSRGDFPRSLLWTVSSLELNLAAELFLALTRQLKQSWIHDVFLSWKPNANVTTFISRHAARQHRSGGSAFARVEWRDG